MRIFIVTQKTQLGGESQLLWEPIGSSLESVDDIEAAIRDKYKPGDVIPRLYKATFEEINTSQAIHATVGHEEPTP